MKSYIKATYAVFSLFLTLSLISCSTFSVRRNIPKPTGSFKTISQGDYAIELDALDSKASEELFGVDLNELGIQAFNVGIENKSDYPIEYDGSTTYLQDKRNYAYDPLDMAMLAAVIYESDKYKYMAKQGGKEGLILGALGAAAGAVIGAVVGKAEKWGPFTVGKDRAGGAAAGATIGGAVGATAGAVKGAMQAKEKATEQVASELMKISLRPEKIRPGTKRSGLLFFQVAGKDVGTLKVGLSLERSETPVKKEQMELELEVAPHPSSSPVGPEKK
ncbi:MAG: hypothetical protein HYY20_08065 [Candidatus Tectomicrobia bacterium]|uniref:Glycine zipper domain-containing protein n=1 Tax=Tectimicrobiota bacterium TaxID=2528274 RepID=A0A932CNU5_UNCTE|nr:hypothetical protein [Candidatus Tectomicrobia bacterium]